MAFRNYIAVLNFSVKETDSAYHFGIILVATGDFDSNVVLAEYSSLCRCIAKLLIKRNSCPCAYNSTYNGIRLPTDQAIVKFSNRVLICIP